MPALLSCSRCHASVESLTAEGTCVACSQETIVNRPVVAPRPDITGEWQPSSIVDETVGHQSSPTAIDQPAIVPTFGHYQLLSELGRGGMGIVYKARQTGLDRIVALKIIRGVVDDDRAKIRFAAEAKALAKITHPHIVGVYDVGEEAGCPYFSMEFVDGQPLSKRIKDGPTFSETEAAKLIEDLAGAVQSAHSVGVLHRDIKPGNVLIGSNGVAKLTDFGLAKNLNEDQGVTVAGSALGTPAYMPPEQAEGRLDDLGPATDVYSLGATLYELLTGQPPFRGLTAGATVAKVLTEDVVSPGQLRKGLSRELEAICLKCLEKNPAKRYISAAGLADDLTRWRSGLSTVARPLSRLKRSWRAVKRRPLAVAGTVAAVVALAVFIATRERDPEKTAQTMLQSGQKVTLIGPTGPPIKLNYLNGAVPVKKPDPNKVFSMQSDSELALELISDPGIDRYRFTIEMKHTGSGINPAIGFYFSRHEVGSEDDTSNLRIIASHNDIDSTRNQTNEKEVARATKQRETCNVIAEHSYHNQTSHNHYLATYKKVTNMGYNPWRTMGFEISPEQLTFIFSDEQGQLVTKTPIEKSNKRIQTMNFFLGRSLDRIYPGQKIPADHYNIRGGIGIFVNDSTAEFRNAIIEPLPPPSP